MKGCNDVVEFSKYISYTKAKVMLNVPEKAGVYKIAVELKNGKKRVIYLGQASNLEERLLDHLQSSEPNECLKNNVSKYKVHCAWAEVSKQTDRDTEEAELIKHYDPECNRQHPAV